MFLKSISLENFRNYEKLDLELAETNQITILTGENAQGKTNLLEAIYLLSIAKSFRVGSYLDLIQTNKDFGRVTGMIEEDGQTKELEVFLSNKPKKIKAAKINQTIGRVTDFLGNFLSVLFSPEDINLVNGEPGFRRRFLNIMISSLDKHYMRALLEYQAILQQRNKLLVLIEQKRGKVAELDFWNEKLVEHGSYIIWQRTETIRDLEKIVPDYYQSISQTEDIVGLEYVSSLTSFSREQTAELFRKELQKRLDFDLKRQTTGIGPHRDEVKFFINGQPLNCLGSRGEYRSFVISLKLAEMAVISKKTGRRPVLLLDDVFSELDEGRQKRLLQAISGFQTIITTTAIEKIESMMENCNIYKVTEGKVMPVLTAKKI